MNTTAKGESVFGKTTLLHPQGICQFLYCLTPNAKLSADLKSLSGATNIGKLDIVWRSNVGERGRLQTSQLQRMVSFFQDNYVFTTQQNFRDQTTAIFVYQ